MGYLEELHSIDEAAVNEVVAEIQREMTIPPTEYPRQKSLRASPDVVSVIENQLEVEVSIAKFEQRLGQMEKSVVSVLKLMRELLSVSAVRREVAENRGDSAGTGT